MDNKQIYKKTIGFSLRRLLWDLIALIAFVGITIAGFIISDKVANDGLIGLLIGFIIGAIIVYILLRFVGYTYKAGQIAMMTEGIVKGKLPDNTIAKGKAIVKSRFKTVAAYYAVTGAIKGVFNQIGNAITKVGSAIGGDTGSAVGSTISSVIQTVVKYLCDCCLGWVFYRKDEGAAKATCEGAVIFFKHGKTLAKNLGRVFGIGILSFLVIAGIVGLISYLIMGQFPAFFADLSVKLAESGSNIPEWAKDPNNLTILFAALIGTVIWAFVHSTFIRPFVLVGVLRNFINSGKDEVPTEKEFNKLDEKSDKFKKLHDSIGQEA